MELEYFEFSFNSMQNATECLLNRSPLTISDSDEVLSTCNRQYRKFLNSLKYVAMNNIEHSVEVLEGSRAVLIPS